ncbi:MAG: hypothetical protein HY913_03305 [Desulfomonile tiedjei]|nr:hypothetical protein [Desulfomonile tiedjei]
MSVPRIISVALVMMSIASMCSVSICLAQGAAQCEAIKKYLGQVEELSTFNFGEDREKRLTEAQKALHEQFTKLGYVVPEELAELLKRYVGLTSLGHDRMRKGDARLLVEGRAVHEKIKKLCPWE